MLSWFQNARELGEKLFMGSRQDNNSFTIKVWRISWSQNIRRTTEQNDKSSKSKCDIGY